MYTKICQFFLCAGIAFLWSTPNYGMRAFTNAVQRVRNYSSVVSKMPDIHEPVSVAGMGKVCKEIPPAIADFIVQSSPRLQGFDRYKKIGAFRKARGLLLIGEPRISKKYLARCIAEQKGFSFLSADAHDLVSELMFEKGEVPKKLNTFADCFDEAREDRHYSSTLVFIDALDALGSRKNNYLSRVRHRAIIYLLAEIKRLPCVFAAGDTIENIDPAFKQPDLFDRIVNVYLPDDGDRKTILYTCAAETRFDRNDINFDDLVEATMGFTPTEIKEIVTMAACCAARSRADYITMKHYWQAFEEFRKKN